MTIKVLTNKKNLKKNAIEELVPKLKVLWNRFSHNLNNKIDKLSSDFLGLSNRIDLLEDRVNSIENNIESMYESAFSELNVLFVSSSDFVGST